MANGPRYVCLTAVSRPAAVVTDAGMLTAKPNHLFMAACVTKANPSAVPTCRPAASNNLDAVRAWQSVASLLLSAKCIAKQPMRKYHLFAS